MASTGNVLPTAAANVDRGGTSNVWSNPTNALTDNATTSDGAVPTDYLVLSSFGFSIPTGATINGVTARVELHETGTGSSNFAISLISNTTPTLIGEAKASGTVSGTTPTVHTLGATNDTWAASPTPTIVNASGFGIAIWSTDTTNTLLIDYATLAIEYTEASTGLASLGVG